MEDDTPWTTYTNELLLVRLDGGEVRRLAHHRSRPFNGYNYSPRASVSRDGAAIAFASNYGWPPDSFTDYVDVYVMSLGKSTLKPSSGGAKAPTSQLRVGERAPFIPDILAGPRERTLLYDYLYSSVVR
jgi:hypothetical protein